MYTSHYLEEKIKIFLSPEDLTHQQFNVLRILRGSHPEPLSIVQIRERMIDRMSDISRIVDRLIKKKLVEKKVCPQDKRVVDIKITTEGLLKLENLDVREHELHELIMPLSSEKASMLSGLLDELRVSDESS